MASLVNDLIDFELRLSASLLESRGA